MVLAFLVGIAPGPAAADVGEDVKSLVVLITCQQEDAESWGAGIIIGAANDRLYIATANHVVQPCRTSPEKLRVQLKSLPGEKMTANVLSDFDAQKDLAVLNVTGLKGLGIDRGALPFDRLGDSSALKRGDPVYALGHPDRNLWRVGLTPDTFVERSGDFLLFESGRIAPGHSGGALLNDRGELEGLLLSDQGHDGKALAIDAAIARLRDWQYPVALRARFTAAELETISAGGGHSCRVTPKGAMYCWGDNSAGQLGSGAEASSTAPVAVAGGLVFVSVSAGWESTCGVTTSGTAYCWGSNDSGQLGDDSNDNRNTPVQVAGGLAVKIVSVGYDHACAIATNGSAYCWGNNDEGQLGNGSTTSTRKPEAVTGGLTFKRISAGSEHTCALTVDGLAYCWGANGRGQLGSSSPGNSLKPVPVAGGLRFAAIDAGQGRTCGVTTSGDAYCWGASEEGLGQLGKGSTTGSDKLVAVLDGNGFRSVKTAQHHTCGVSTRGAVSCWGGGPLALLGSDVTDSPVPVPVATQLEFAAVSLAFSHTCGLTTGGDVYCWGSNKYGQLGIGSNADKLMPARVNVQP
jgi:alpha-tubulin suppressor-like RCC1 family protein